MKVTIEVENDIHNEKHEQDDINPIGYYTETKDGKPVYRGFMPSIRKYIEFESEESYIRYLQKTEKLSKTETN